ncbi:hypothetical protein SPRG_10524 [Saprolegnia parasitica CBS 223.65]|uniref:Fido domain-containing protein n=1 Tax=Saprolegnia parasitica (strain CBS 223.65) TaxID=695850 RepID=A0A067CAC3_SAPPC|nr:hypothetical protein SPRG_10524 [Saprolegnia parasitica CBS 223.65]KDO23747.1 hypothetical protein SPRG_10524 [Saprolegnia parasitica CBS 223.65]|eukprot:XP_012205564.1 hypothetical protein SPRG_10524 [Saprolegnia parasitica CBS 223.65]
MAEVPPMVRDTTALCWAAGMGDTDLLLQLIDAGADVNLADYDQRTPLHIAVSDGKSSVVEMLLKAGANVYKKDRWGATPLDCAKDPSVVSVLAQFVRFQSDVPFASDRARPPLSRRSPHNLQEIATAARSDVLDPSTVFAAVQAGDTETLKRAWLDGLKVDVTDALGRTALHVAVEHEQLDVIELLLSAGAKVDAADAVGRTPMSLAVDANSSAIVDVLRQRHQPPPPPSDNRMALAFEAIKRGNVAYLMQLVPQSVHPDVQDYDARSLLHVASSEGDLRMCQYLVECGANVNALDRWGSSPLAEATYFAHHDVARYLRAHYAVEHGHAYDEAMNQMDPSVLDTAIEHVLRTVCAAKWSFGEACIPVKDEDSDGCAIVLHSVWFRPHNIGDDNVDMTRDAMLPVLHAAWSRHANGGAKLDPILLFRKARGLMLVDPGQDHRPAARVGRQPHAHAAVQILFGPHARKAGLKSLLSVPMVAKLAVVAVLSWYSHESYGEDVAYVQRIQRLVKGVTLLCSLKHETHLGMSRYQYCYALESALTGAGELLYPSVTADELALHDVVSLALTWRLFDYIDKIATSMSSEDHWAAVNILASLVGLVTKGLFDDVISGALLELTPDDLTPSITTKAELVQHVFYYLSYWTAVSPTEGDFFSKVHHLYNELQRHVHPSTAPAPVLVVEEPPPVASDELECILCKYKVSGHIHRGKMPPPAVVAPPPPLAPPPSLFGRVPSPVLRELEQLPRLLADEFDRSGLQAKLANRAFEGFSSTPFTMSDVYDALGSAHDRKGAFRPSTPPPTAALLSILNTILVDPRSVVSHDQVLTLHRAVCEAAGETGGMARDNAAVGYASERIYRVFLPAEEIASALTLYVRTLNQPFQHPLVTAYYAFAALVFFIHPFYDGNGRTARLLGNVLARKGGYPSIFRHVDKTIQLTPFLETAMHTLEMQETVRRTRQGRLAKGSKTTSTWF